MSRILGPTFFLCLASGLLLIVLPLSPISTYFFPRVYSTAVIPSPCSQAARRISAPKLGLLKLITYLQRVLVGQLCRVLPTISKLTVNVQLCCIHTYMYIYMTIYIYIYEIYFMPQVCVGVCKGAAASNASRRFPSQPGPRGAVRPLRQAQQR